LADEFAEAIRVHVRYEMRREDGTTRRERNEQFGQPVPTVYRNPEFEYLWDWFWEINSGVNRDGDGHCRKITWADYSGWEIQTETIVRPDERAILRAMDDAFVKEANAEIKAQFDKAQQAAKAK